MADFDGRVALITGASGNLGAAVARAFAARGARLALVERRPEKLERAFPEWAASPDHLFGRADLTDAEAVAAIAQAAVERFGRIDILVNTAGGYRAGAPAHQTPAEDWDFLLDLNLRTAVNASRAVVPHMLRRGEGKIVHTAARAALAGRANMAAYVISKSTIIRLTESMAAELK
ncbi:MAG: SDR family NAD(P)-dependent oxidoreductase, partial [Candidatus Promineifilaceae bacterium]